MLCRACCTACATQHVPGPKCMVSIACRYVSWRDATSGILAILLEPAVLAIRPQNKIFVVRMITMSRLLRSTILEVLDSNGKRVSHFYANFAVNRSRQLRRFNYVASSRYTYCGLESIVCTCDCFTVNSYTPLLCWKLALECLYTVVHSCSIVYLQHGGG